MTALDRLIQRLRIREAKRFLKPGMRVLDIGCADGALFDQVPNLGGYVGLDPALPPSLTSPGLWIGSGRRRFVRGHFPDDVPEGPPFDAITLLAVLEHLDETAQAKLATGCADKLKPGGLLIVTVPAPVVDRILDVLMFLRLVDGMAAEEHHGFDVRQTPSLFERAGLRLIVEKRFEMGLNHLFVFQNRA